MIAKALTKEGAGDGGVPSKVTVVLEEGMISTTGVEAGNWSGILDLAS